MTLTLLFTAWMAFVAFMVWLNHKRIEEDKKSPIHKHQFAVRLAVGSVFLVAGWFLLPAEHFWTMPTMLIFSFFGPFDTFLSLSRGRKAWELDVKEDPEEDSSIDGWQVRKFGVEKLPIVMLVKWFLGLMFTTLYFYGWGAVLSY